MAKNRKLGRTSDIRKSMLRSLATEVIVYGKVETTVTRAKEVRSVVDELITLGKRGDLHARRQAAAYVRAEVANDELLQICTKLLMKQLEKQLFKSYLMTLHLNSKMLMVDILLS